MRTCLSFCVLALAFAAHAVIIDRVAVTVGTRVITDSEIDQSIRLAAFENNEQPDFGADSRREAAERLIDQKLAQREMDLGHYPRADAEQSHDLVVSYTADHYHGDANALRAALTAASLTPADLEQMLAAEADLLNFLSLRFRPAIQVSDEDIQAYFDAHIAGVPNATPKSLNEVRSGIEQIIAGQRADHDLDEWLADQRKRTRIVYLVPELQNTGAVMRTAPK